MILLYPSDLYFIKKSSTHLDLYFFLKTPPAISVSYILEIVKVKILNSF